ncbi:MAG: HAD family hydrolase [Myxococcota bacterium]
MAPPSDTRSKAVVFDLDGVLVDSEGLRFGVYRDLLAGYGVELSVEVYEREWVMAGRGPEYAVETWDLPVTAAEMRALRAPLYVAALEAGLRPMPGAREALDRLSKGHRLALATNSVAAEVEIALERLGPDAPFDAVVSREDYARRKPAPDAFLEAARRLGVPAPRCLVVEDADRGVRAARAAGMACVAVRHPLNGSCDFAGARRVLGSLDELTSALVEALLPTGA